MKKLLKSEICGSMNSTRYALMAEKSKKSQTLRLLYMNSSCKSHKRVKKKKKQTQMQTWFPNVAKFYSIPPSFPQSKQIIK